MINYTEKGSGLQDAIAEAGHYLYLLDNEWVSSDDVAVQAIIDSYTLDQAKAVKSKQVSKIAKSLRDKVVENISAGEMASWSIKRSEAISFKADGDTTKCPMLSQEASARGVSMADLVSKVENNSTNFSNLEAAIGGADGKHRDAISALTSFEAVASYDYSTGWPEV